MDILHSIDIGDTQLDLVSINNVYYTHPAGEDFIKDVSYNLMDNLVPPISSNDIAGTARFVLDDNTAIDISLYPARSIDPPESSYSRLKRKITEHRDIYYLLIVLLALEGILILYNIIRLVNRLFKKIL